MATMHAAVFEEYGNPVDALKHIELQLVEPEKGQIRLKLIMSPVHNHDLLLIRGEYGYKPELPMIAGSEGVGTIDKIGPGVKGFKIGQRVAVSDISAVWADYFIVDADHVVRIPEGLSDELAAQLLGMPLSAIAAMDELDAHRDEWIVINAANGAVGRTIAQIAMARGVNVASIVNRDEAKTDLEDQGIDNVFVASSDNSWIEAVRSQIGKAHVAGGVDMVSGPMAGQLASLISDGGILLSFGAMSQQPLQINPADLIFKQISVKGFWNALQQKQMAPGRRKKLIDELVALGVSGKLKLPFSNIFALDHAAEAAAASGTKRNGKVMIAARSIAAELM